MTMKRFLCEKTAKLVLTFVLALVVFHTLLLMKETLLERVNTAGVHIKLSRGDERNFGMKTRIQSNSKDLTTEPGTSTKQAASSKDRSKLEYHGHDLLSDIPYSFDERFKNPCWYEFEQLRCLPYFFIVGAKKCGTSELFRKISFHPQVINPGFKEPQFFARTRFKPARDDINVYIDRFQHAADIIESHTTKQSRYINPLVTGEGSPSNLHLNSHWMYLPGNEHLSEPRVVILDYIKHFVPDAKIIVTFRDPIESKARFLFIKQFAKNFKLQLSIAYTCQLRRVFDVREDRNQLYSDYYHEYGFLNVSNDPSPRQFHEVVVNGIQLYEDCFRNQSVRSCVYNPSLYLKTKILIQLGIYYVFWEELLRVFSRDQILLLQNKDLAALETLLKVYEFLELDPLPTGQLKQIQRAKPANVRRQQDKEKGPMLNSTLKLLYRFYKPFNEKMANLTNDPTFLYSHDDELGE